MNARLCVRLGLVLGGAVGALISLLHGLMCCTPPHPPSWAELARDGILVALITAVPCAAFASLVIRLNLLAVLLLAFVIAIPVGVLLGPPAYHMAQPAVALLVCGLLGALLGWLVCWLFCQRFYRGVSK
jgi:hypothetical protein